MAIEKEYVIFGAGDYGRRTLQMLGADKVAFFVDNDEKKDGIFVDGVEVWHFSRAANKLKDFKIIIAITYKYIDEVTEQLNSIGAKPCKTYLEMVQQETLKKIKARPDYIGIYKKAIAWIEANTVKETIGSSIVNTTVLPKGYPEVTGYFIPSLIRWGYRKLAIDYAHWLMSIQHEDGSWYDTLGEKPYVFDTAQILKGLLAVYSIAPNKEIKNAIVKGAKWLECCIQFDGQLKVPDESIWNNPRYYSELIHLYCLSPLIEVADKFQMPELAAKAQLSLVYYKNNYRDEILHFSLLSHFYAYVMEALIDLGEIDIAKEAMANIAKLQNEDGAVPGHNDVKWVCSTGLFQLAVVWFRLGDIERGNRAFAFACKLQNESGGWYGSYPVDGDTSNDYFPASEISWAVKYFLDALYYKARAEFDVSAPRFKAYIDKNDERYRGILDTVKDICALGGNRILDVGCGKGRYLRNLAEDVPQGDYYGVDISSKVIAEKSDKNICWDEGTLTCIPFEDNFFSLAYTCEALEHTVDIKNAIREMSRVVRTGGKIIVIDKNSSTLGTMDIGEWEQWFDEIELADIMKEYCSHVQVIHDVDYEDHFKKDLFSVWIGTVK